MTSPQRSPSRGCGKFRLINVPVLDGSFLNLQAKERLAHACTNFAPFSPVCRRLLLQAGFGNALASEIIPEPNWSALQKILDDAGVRETESKEAFARRLGPLLVNKSPIFLDS